jgi:hypothetical protein
VGRRQALAADVKADRPSSRDAVVNLGLETIEVVAKRLHPERADPLLHHGAEALAVIEQASAGLRRLRLRQLLRRPRHRRPTDVASPLAASSAW